MPSLIAFLINFLFSSITFFSSLFSILFYSSIYFSSWPSISSQSLSITLYYSQSLYIALYHSISLSSLMIFLCYSPFLSITLNHSLVSHPRSWPWIWKLSTIHPISLAAVWAAKKPEGALTLWQRIHLNFWLVPIKIFCFDLFLLWRFRTFFFSS